MLLSLCLPLCTSPDLQLALDVCKFSDEHHCLITWQGIPTKVKELVKQDWCQPKTYLQQSHTNQAIITLQHSALPPPSMYKQPLTGNNPLDFEERQHRRTLCYSLFLHVSFFYFFPTGSRSLQAYPPQ